MSEFVQFSLIHIAELCVGVCVVTAAQTVLTVAAVVYRYHKSVGRVTNDLHRAHSQPTVMRTAPATQSDDAVELMPLYDAVLHSAWTSTTIRNAAPRHRSYILLYIACDWLCAWQATQYTLEDCRWLAACNNAIH